MADKGLGDTLSRVFKILKFKECGGCGRRREMLNLVFPYPQKESPPEPPAKIYRKRR